MSDTEASSEDVSEDEVPILVTPYAHEPPPQTGREGPQKKRQLVEYADREGNVWCQCGECCSQENPANRYCCREQERILEKIEEHSDEQLKCVTLHPGYRAITENVYVLEVAYLEYKSRYEPMVAPIDKKLRYCAYRQFVRWIWHRLGKDNRKPLPSCVMKRIRTVFPSEESVYTGFKHVPSLQ